MVKKKKQNLIITINDTHSVEDDGSQYILFENKINSKGVPYRQFIGSFKTMHYLLRRLARLNISSKHQQLTIEGYLGILRNELQELKKAVGDGLD